MNKAAMAAIALKAVKNAYRLMPRRGVQARLGPVGVSRIAAPGFAAGVAVAYFLDPAHGKRRRHAAKDRLGAAMRSLSRTASRQGRYVAGKRHGLIHALSGDEQKDPNDPTLQHKIESEVLRHYLQSGVNVNVQEGVAVLRGTLERPEDINSLVGAVRRVDGVLDVVNLLHLPGTPAPSERR